MPTFIDTGEEYLNAAHIISIDTIPGDETIWIRLDTGERFPRSQPNTMITNGSWHQRKRLLNRLIRIPRQNKLQLNMEHAVNSIKKGKETASVKI